MQLKLKSICQKLSAVKNWNSKYTRSQTMFICDQILIGPTMAHILGLHQNNLSNAKLRLIQYNSDWCLSCSNYYNIHVCKYMCCIWIPNLSAVALSIKSTLSDNWASIDLKNSISYTIKTSLLVCDHVGTLYKYLDTHITIKQHWLHLSS